MKGKPGVLQSMGSQRIRHNWATELNWMKVKRKVQYLSLSCVQLFANPWDCSPLGSSVHGVFQARVLEWVAISFSRGSSWSRDWTRSPALQADSLPSEPPGKLFNHDRVPWQQNLSWYRMITSISQHITAAQTWQLPILKLYLKIKLKPALFLTIFGGQWLAI